MSELVLDLTRLLPGPLCTKLLQLMGLRVLRLVSPHGDLLANFSPKAYEWLNAGKEVETVNLKTSAGAQRFLHLVRDAAVVIESNLPGKMEGLGVGPERLKAINPKLAYVRLSAYRGTSANPTPGHDLTYLASAGLLNQLDPAWKSLPIADVCGAFWSALAVLQSLRSGGGFCEVYLDEAVLVLGWPQLPAIDGSKCCYGVYAAAEGHVALAAPEAHLWNRFCDALGRHDWKHAAFTSTTPSNLVYEQICSTFLSRTAQQWEEWALEAEIPLRAVRMQPRQLTHAPWSVQI